MFMQWVIKSDNVFSNMFHCNTTKDDILGRNQICMNLIEMVIVSQLALMLMLALLSTHGRVHKADDIVSTAGADVLQPDTASTLLFHHMMHDFPSTYANHRIVLWNIHIFCLLVLFLRCLKKINTRKESTVHCFACLSESFSL